MHCVKNNDIKDKKKKISKITNRKKKLEKIYQYRRKKTIRFNL